MWQCPKCKSLDLNVEIQTTARLIQDEYVPNFETDIIGDHEWGRDSTMSCRACQHCDVAAAFETAEEESPPCTASN